MLLTAKEMTAVKALEKAHWIAFAPFVFQASVSLRNLGILEYIFDQRHAGGPTAAEIAEKLSLSRYGVEVLLEIAETSDIVCKDPDLRYELTKVGYFLNYSPTASVNLNFANDVCYKGLFHLENSIKNGKPEGLKELGQWKTIYEGLSQLKPLEQKSWFDFDHHYSDHIFEEAMGRIFLNKPRTIFDIGGNTGKFSIQCCSFDPEVRLKIVDLPGQLEMARVNAKENGFEDRISTHPIDWLSEDPQIPKGADLIWMSQFLDCFSEEEIVKILKVCAGSMDDLTEVAIVETFTDRQTFKASQFILEATSLYFTVLANGNSKMYPSGVFKRLIEQAGLEVKEDIRLGEYHTMLVCRKK
ncbi:MAG: SAM-dependent methyltransferase [Flavobacteriales bacterium]|nr:SAM-dependent methyltransferase [Flavobacteriales bacterium]MBK7247654.1 SAM-dependent methyltransferase [Flavobacteriales bacterium]MBK7286604.1 SAM-dependent methyltransferase [Flavobacteriales bacterium]MBK9597018.1 SAM-dependent methyltransferase [Flavobacteriales bacterium]QQS72931.1 MAG: SAM-dependent methyltransferase [Flavobacteriales bacterium]